jgi:hypothetical protein
MMTGIQAGNEVGKGSGSGSVAQASSPRNPAGPSRRANGSSTMNQELFSLLHWAWEGVNPKCFNPHP